MEKTNIKPVRPRRIENIHRKIGKGLLFILSLVLFILAITLMKEGAHDLSPLVTNLFHVSNPMNSLGFGWLFAYIVMSGSPVAAAALTFLDAGIIDQFSTFMMITGSRLGASFIVLFIGFIYVLQGRNRTTSLSMGLLSLIVTGTIHIAGIVFGVILINNGMFNATNFHFSAVISSITSLIFDPIIFYLGSLFPLWFLFIIGFLIILLSFSLFDKALPQMTLKESHLGRTSRLVYKPWVMFLLGAGITMISMSVSVSLSILVPLSQRGFIRRENVIPYILGANVTTFIDTLIAAAMIENQLAFSVVLIEIISITIISLIILTLFFHPYQNAILNIVNKISENNRNLTLFMLGILIIPILFLLL